MLDNQPDNRSSDAWDAQNQIAQLTAMNQFLSQLSASVLEFDVFLKELVTGIVNHVRCDRAILLITNEQEAALEYSFSNYQLPSPDRQAELSALRLSVYQADHDPLLDAWLAGEPVMVQTDLISPSSTGGWLAQFIQSNQFLSVPFIHNVNLIGVVLVDNPVSGVPVTAEHQAALMALAGQAAILLHNAQAHQRIVRKLADSVTEMSILRQIDRELSDTIDLRHVFKMTLDWVLRFTNAQAASIALYNQETDELRFVAEYGYDIPGEQLATLRQEYGPGIALRVARNGHAEIVPDVSMDKDFVPITSSTRSQVAVPVMREDRVVAVITVESKRLNGFSEQNLDFIEKLATRAGVAIDNARLYDEAVREREKLSLILSNTADIVMAVGLDDRLILLNQSALAALHLYLNESYVGLNIFDAVDHTPLLDMYRRAKALGENLVEEVLLPNGRIFHANLQFNPSLGWIVVMHDITPFKEMDKLKSELIATVSHDLKQPLSVMNGYIELLLMQQAVANQGMHSVQMIRRSIQSMRQLIDDLLDLAKIESGIQLKLTPVQINTVITDCIDSLRPAAQNKSMTIIAETNNNLPPVTGDYDRLRQILMNLINNAVKYTPPEGKVMVCAEKRGNMLRVAVQDNGLGISPEDQIHIFDRFYRVRRPETDSIEGTGLGLAIVKSLVEAHRGQISVESTLGRGSTFYLMLPLAEENLQDGPS
ncbi:MAG: GAF domain-containing protein [Chloroflexi bacterium]|nr:GAF domain-containing protein [Chloroflexota bacterium]